MSHLAEARNILIPQHFGSTIFCRQTSRYLPFDHPATALWKQLATRPMSALAKGVDGETLQQFMGFFEQFYPLGLFTYDEKFDGILLDIESPSDHLTGPLAVHLEVAATCNLTCKHCFAGELPRHDVPLTLEEIDRLCATLAHMGSFRLGLTGGEPLSRRDIFDIMDIAASYGLHPCLTTNALLITEDIAREFGKRDLIWLNVSLDGATPETNDLIRGKGVFNRVLDKLKILSQHTPFTLAFTIMKNNIAEIEACAKLAYEVGATTAVFRPMYPVGIGQHHLDLMPTFEEYNQALNTLAGMQTDSAFDVCNIDPFSPTARTETQSKVFSNQGCGAGNTVCSISISGDVNPCSFLGDAHVSGNIRQSRFEDIWHSSQGFTTIRNLPGGEDAFNGGCRVRSLVFNGSINAPDPWVTAQQGATPRTPNVTFYHPMHILEVGSDYK